MARPCTCCKHPKRDEIDRKLRAGVTFIDVERWLATLGTDLTSQSIAKHAKSHVGVQAVRGRRVASGDFLENVRDTVADALAAGVLSVTVKDGIAAQKALDARIAKEKDRDWQLKLVMALTGHVPQLRVIDPDREALEAEFRPLLTAGAD
jgi:hypothetical protein